MKTLIISSSLAFVLNLAAFSQSDTLKRRQPEMVINYEMIEMFYRAYDKIEVFPWRELLADKSFDGARTLYAAYNKLNMDSVAPKMLQYVLEQKAKHLKESINNSNNTLYKQNSIKYEDLAKLE